MAAITAKWTKLAENDTLKRSSPVVSLINGQAYVFGGELDARKPSDNDVHVIALNANTSPSHNLKTHPANPPSASPSPRVGAAATTLNGKSYLFSGRGGAAMTPIEETGSVWEFDPTSLTWTIITPASSSSPYPPPRSDHAMASDGVDTIYLHAGSAQPGNGTSRLSDLWSFSLSSRQWTMLPGAPDPPRGETALAFADGKLYRMHGFDGEIEQGGQVNSYSPDSEEWETWTFTADGVAGPAPRSASALVPVRMEGKTWLVVPFGKGDPSAMGNEGQGKVWNDVWALDVEGRVWQLVDAGGGGGAQEIPRARGWFAADGEAEKGKLVLQGGLDEENQRLGDVWVLSFGGK